MITSGEPVHWLRGGELHVGISLASGALVGVRHGDWAVLDRGELGRSFRLLLPVTGRRANYVDGSDQPPPVCQVGEDGRSVTAAWSAVRDERGVVHDIAVRTTIAVVGDGIVFSADIDNRAREAVVENVYFPDLGDVRPPPSGRLQTFAYSYATARRTGIWPNFANEPGYYGVDHPTFAATPLAEAPVTPPAPWILLDGATQGLHFRVDRPSAEPVTWFAELEPGYDDSMSSHAPAAPEIAGHAVTVHFAAVHLPFIRPGEHRELTPVAMTGYRGDWHAGVDLYIRRRAEWGMPTAAPPHWARQPHSWLQLQLNSPEGERRTTFAELPEIAAECAANGVAAIQLVGWNEGGQDQNNPAHDVDEQLGGRDELRRAIAECHRRGVHVVLFTKFTWADRATERFRRHLIREAVKDPYGDYYMHPGYRYQTMTQLLDINTKRLIPMCFLSERYLEVCREEFAKIVDLEPAGMLFDEAQHHGPALVCFDETHGHRAGAPVYANDRELVRLLRKTPNLPDDFLFACEAPYDWELEAHQLGYHRSEDPGHVPLSRYLRPDAVLMTAVTGFDDRNMINQCLLYRYVISYEPFNFKGRLRDMPDTVAYGQAMDTLRRELREWFWDATFVDTVGVKVTRSDGRLHRPYSAFRHADGRYAAVVANYSDAPVDGLRVALSGQDLPMRYRLVDSASWRPEAAGIHLPPRSAAAVVPDA